MLKNDLAKKNVWIFDLDNTVYSPDTRIFDQIDNRMKLYISQKLKLTENRAFRLQKFFYKEYGTTLYGLMKHYKFEPQNFLDFVHDIKFNTLTKSEELIEKIKILPGKRIIYTNGDEKYASKILKNLGILDLFYDIYDIKKANYLPKPMLTPLKSFLKHYDIEAQNCAYFEDLEKNLKPAHKIGITTFHITDKEIKKTTPFIDFRFKTIINALDMIKNSII